MKQYSYRYTYTCQHWFYLCTSSSLYHWAGNYFHACAADLDDNSRMENKNELCI